MRKVSIADFAGGLALASISLTFAAWAFKVLVETGNRDAWSWSAIESTGTWFAGFGTLAAVLVSLYLARRSDRRAAGEDYLRGRMTALRYNRKLMEVKSDLVFLKTWAESKAQGPRLIVDTKLDSAVLKRLSALELDVALDDLVRLAPIEEHFAERLHLVSMQLKVCNGSAEPLESIIAFLDDPDQGIGIGPDSQRLNYLEHLLSQLVSHTDVALGLLDPLLNTCGKFAFSIKQMPRA
ncbi:hypothetical protein [Paraburkholderia sp. JHI869]|uniref:hypothetical protein n=1 Tax=Paraburkholderia sp. JHI869 TaxID=3112959 RepID=UPI00317BA8DB